MPAAQEFPRPDERRFGQDYRFAWAIGIPEDGNAAFLGAHPLYRHDLKTGTRNQHDFGLGRVPGEFVFVPRAADAPEGEGWMIGYVIDTATETTDLVILDAGRYRRAAGRCGAYSAPDSAGVPWQLAS